MKDIYKNRFLVWLMWLFPIAATGWLSITIWTIIQIVICYQETEKQAEFEKPIRERRMIIEMNREENLSEKDKQILKNNPNLIKVGEGVYINEGK